MLRKNVSGQFIHFAGINATTGAALTGATFSVRRSIDGTFAAGGGTITEDTGLGLYKCALTQADTNGNDLAFFFTATNAIPICLNVLTTAADPSDGVRLGLTALPNAAAAASGGVPVIGTGANTFKSDASANVTFANTSIATVTELTNSRAKYMHGAVWIGSVANTNATIYVDGITTNPVSTMAAALSVAGNTGLRRFWTQAGVTTTLSATVDGYVFDGYGWKLALASRDISNSVFMNCISVTGISSSASSTSFPCFVNCEFGATATIPPANLTHCEFGGAVTLGAAGNYDFINCASVVAGTSAPSFAVPAGTVNINFRRWAGGITISGITSATTISIDAVSGGTVTLTGADGNVQVRGMVNIDDQRTGAPTLGKTQVVTPKTIWQDAVAADFTTTSSIGKALFIDNVAPGGSGGHLISGSNAGTTTLGALTVTGAYTQTGATNYTGQVTYNNGVTMTGGTQGSGLLVNGTTNGTAAVFQGSGTGHGIYALSGGGATGDGMRLLSTATAGNGLYSQGAGAAGDGIEAVAGGGVPIRGDLTGNITGTLATVTQVTNAVLLSNGTGTGQVSFTSGIISADTKKINGTTITGNGGVGTEFGV